MKISSSRSDLLLTRLADLASEKIQIRFCVNGTASEYLVADYILDYVLDTLGDLISSPKSKNQLERIVGEEAMSHMMAIDDLFEANRHFLEKYEFATLEDLILRDPIWVEMRDHAQAALSLVGFDLDKHERGML